MGKPVNFKPPVGRLVGGSIYEPKTTDYYGNPLVFKSGPNIGQPRIDYSFGVAIPKTPGTTHWSQDAWGKLVWDAAHAAFPNGEAQRQDFAWKITDGDSTIPKKGRNGQPGRKPCDMVGHPGNWVIWFSGSTPPQVWNKDGSARILEKDAIKPGYYIEVFGNINDNTPSQSPGMYINHSMVALSGYGEEIAFGPDVSEAGFGQAPLPVGASPIPTGGFNPAVIAPPPAQVAPSPVYVPPAVPSQVAPGVPVVPNPAFMQVPPPPVSKPLKMMLPAAMGLPYEKFITEGWTDDMLIQNGMMAKPSPN